MLRGYFTRKIFVKYEYDVKQLIGVSKTAHTTHYAQHIVIGSIDTDLGGFFTSNTVG